MNKKRLISGIKPTGNLTLGNYIGAILNFKKFQDEYECLYFVADLHSLTTNEISPEELKRTRKEIIAWYLAAGIDPEKTIIFYQSDITELGLAQWVIANETTIGELNRMTQFKDKTQKLTKMENGTLKIPTGLLFYPTLMATDILIYNADIVPIGEDQTQHLELTRNIGQRINKKYKLNFKIPNGLVPKVGAKIKSLIDPNVKMSKSDKNSKGVIYLNDDPTVAYNKILKAVTDSENKIYISEDKPGILNLLNIYAALENISLEQAQEKFKDKNYGEFKLAVAEIVKKTLTDLQSKYNQFLPIVDQIAKNNVQKAKRICVPFIDELMKKRGFEY
ncbi:tryptophan--tRNA ligase [Mycoplasmopsis hyopharyngis]|uniref:tryptophan--tRNA ligase n=1 Tax=Mycoplasmopsis hyopharyngis TaxID=29558 RepID=UPI0038735C5D